MQCLGKNTRLLTRADQEEAAGVIFVQQVENSDHLLLIVSNVKANSAGFKDIDALYFQLNLK